MNDSPPAAHLLLSTAREVENRIETALDAVGLSLAKLNVLSRLVEAGEPVPLGSLAEKCSCVRSNMTQLIDRLEEEQLVERLGDPKDRRSVRAVLTATGRERHAAGAKVLAETEEQIFGRFAEIDRQALARIAALVRAEE
jgi:DNA-binding MarR family transcriptional regulator